MEFHQKDITTVECGIIGHCVNCQGAMGSGVARALYEKWPKVKSQYLQRPTGEGMLGYCDIVVINPLLSVGNIYGQFNFGNDGGRYGDPKAVEQGLEYLFRHAIHMGIEDIFLPYKMASDRAGLDWDTEVLPIINRLDTSNPLVNVHICVYKGE